MGYRQITFVGDAVEHTVFRREMIQMENFDRTSNTAIVAIRQINSPHEADNVQAHVKQKVLKQNARKEYQKYNISFDTGYSGKRYSRTLKDKLKTGTKYDKSTLADDEFWVGRTYKKGSGKTTCYIESMVFAPPFKIKPEELDSFMESEEATIFEAFKDYLLHSDRFADCRFLNMELHCNEIYYPQTMTDEAGKEIILTEEQSKEMRYCKPHLHVTYIPLVKSKTKSGEDYFKLSRGDLWKAKNGRFTESYTEELDEMYEKVFKLYGLERGEIRKDMPETDRPVEKLLEDWQRETDIKNFEKIAEQQVQELEDKRRTLAEDIEEHNQVVEHLQECKEALDERIIQDVAIWGNDTKRNYDMVEMDLIKSQNDFLRKVLSTIEKVLTPLAKVFPNKLGGVIDIIRDAFERLSAQDLYKDEIERQRDYNNR